MKTGISIAVVALTMIAPALGKAQVCMGHSAVVNAPAGSGLTNLSYSMNPGGVTSATPQFTIAVVNSPQYTLYTTGTNSNSALVTYSTFVNANGVDFTLTATSGFSLGCNSKSVAVVHIVNAQTLPVPGGPVSYTLIPPGSPTIVPSGTLSTISTVSMTVPGTWYAVVKDNVTMCSKSVSFQVTTNTAVLAPPALSSPAPAITCASPVATIQANALPGISYHWQPVNVAGTVVNYSVSGSTPNPSIAVVLTLTATDLSNGCSSSTVVPVLQNAFVPTASISTGLPNGTCITPSVMLTNASSSGIPPGTFPAGAPVVASLWQGPAPQSPATLVTSYVAYTSGVYTMQVTDNNNGCTGSATINVNITPSAAFIHTVSSGVATFSSTSAGAGANTMYYWEFGDGSYSTAQHPTHTYQAAGSYLVKLKLTNSGGVNCADSTIMSLNVNSAPCVANSGFSMAPTATPQVWNVMPSYPWNVTAARWDWGDGSSTNTLYTSHQYSAAGMYTICLSVTIACQGTSSTCTSYSVYRSSQDPNIIAVHVVNPELSTGTDSREYSPAASVIPNPNTGEFNLSFSSYPAGAAEIRIFDVTGRIYHREIVEIDDTEMTIRPGTGELPAGLYFITVDASGSRTTVKMIVNR